MFDEGIGNLCSAFIQRAHQVNTAPGRVHLSPEDPVCRTGGETQTAMDAIEVKFIGSVRHPRAVLDSVCLPDQRRVSFFSSKRIPHRSVRRWAVLVVFPEALYR